MTNLVLREDRAGAAILTLNRPEKMNALTKDVFEALEVHIDAIARATRTIGVVVLRGARGNFSAGYDMTEVLEYVRASAKPHYHSDVWGLSLRLPHRVGRAKATEMMLTCRAYSGIEAQAMHLANLCFEDDQFEAELSVLCADILANSWYANQVNKRALIESDGLALRDAHALELFKNEGLAPDAVQRVANFISRRKSQT